MSVQQITSHGGAVELATQTTFRVWIDQDLCTGDGLCVDVVPEVFTLLEDGIAYVCQDGEALNDPGMAESQAIVPARTRNGRRPCGLDLPG